MIMHTSLIRMIDLKQKSNKWILGISLLFFLVFFMWAFYSGNNLFFCFKVSITKAICCYLCWSFARELDPDAKIASFYSIIPLAILFFFVDELLVLPGLYFLFLVRLLSRSVGINPNNFDLLIILFFSLYLYLFYSFMFPLAGAFFIFADYKLKGGQKRNLPYAAILFAISLLSFINIYSIEKIDSPFIGILFVSLITPIYAFRLSTLNSILSTCDSSRYFLSPKRIKLANVMLLLSSLAIAINYGYIFQLGYIWMAILGISAPHIKNIKKIQAAEL